MKQLCHKGIKINSLLVVKPCNARQKAVPLNVSKCDNTERCYNNNHNLGKLSDVSFTDLSDAILRFMTVSYSTEVFTNLTNNEIYLSYNTYYNPVITHRVSKQKVGNKIYYKFVSVDDKGKVLNLTTIKA